MDTYSVGPRGSSLRSPSSFAHPFLLRGVMAPPAAPPGSALSVVGFHKLLVSLSIVALFTHFGGRQRMRGLDGITDSMYMSLGIFWASGDLRELPRVPLRGEGSCGGPSSHAAWVQHPHC